VCYDAAIVHGIIMNQLRQFVVDRHGRDAWHHLTAVAGTGTDVYLISETYPDEHLVALTRVAAQHLGTSVALLEEEFGRFLVPTLMRVYGSLFEPTWKTLDVIAYTESAMHRAVRLRDTSASPPALVVKREGPDRVVIEYVSARRLCHVAEGIAQGFADHFSEQVEIHQSACMLRGDPRCEICVRILLPS
jgi:hypothetical protein